MNLLTASGVELVAHGGETRNKLHGNVQWLVIQRDNLDFARYNFGSQMGSEWGLFLLDQKWKVQGINRIASLFINFVFVVRRYHFIKSSKILHVFNTFPRN